MAARAAPYVSRDVRAAAGLQSASIADIPLSPTSIACQPRPAWKGSPAWNRIGTVMPRSFFDGNPAYRQIAQFELSGPETDGNAIVVYEKTAVTQPPAHEKQPYPPNLMIRDGRVSGIYYAREAQAVPTRQSDR